MNNYNCIIVLGPTASGKTSVAIKIASAINGEIISIDSRQVYQNLNIGTGKDLKEYYYQSKLIPYHLIDIAAPFEKYNIYRFTNDFYKAFSEISIKNKLPVLCGGTALYLNCLIQKSQFIGIPVNKELRENLADFSLDELNEKLKKYPVSLTKNIDTSTKKRTIRGIEIAQFAANNNTPDIKYHDLKPLVIGIDNGIENRKQAIKIRLQQRMDEGLIEEAQNLLKMGVTHEQFNYFGLEYKYLSQYLNNAINKVQFIELLSTAIIQYAKRQMTFFRKLEKEGLVIQWMTKEKALSLDILSLFNFKNE